MEILKKEEYEKALAASRDRRMKWWREARFGMFVHYGLYSIIGRHEWVMAMEGIDKKDYEKYAEQFIRTRLATKPVSKSHLYRQLAEHHVPSEIITEFLAKIPEENELQNAVEIAAKFYRQFQSLEPETRRMRVLSRLEARGFRFDVSQRAYEKAQANTEEE